MPRVPYNPVPDVSPTASGERIAVNTPGAAFGENIGAALEHLGTTTDQVGNELFTRAVSIQQLQQEADARKAVADSIQEQGLKQADFDNLQGKNKVDALPGHLADSRAIIQKYRDTLTSPIAQKAYDAESQSFMARTTVQSATQAGAAAKKYQVDTINSKIAANLDSVLQNPKDPKAVQQWVADNKALVQQRGDILGNDQATTDFDISKTNSSFYRNQVRGISNTDPPGGARLFRDLQQKGLIRGEDVEPTLEHVRQQVYTTGARNASMGLRTGSDISLGAGVVSMARAKDAIASNEGNDYNSIGPQTGKLGHALGKYQVMEGNLSEWLREAGMPTMTSQQFLADHKAQEQLFESRFGNYMKSTGNFNDAASMWFSGKTMKEAGNASDGHWTTPQYIMHANAALYKTASQGEVESTAEAKGNQLGQDFPLAGDFFRNFAGNRYRAEQTTKKNDIYDAKESIVGLLAGGQVKDFSDLQKTPEGVAALEKAQKAAPDYYLRLPGIITRYNDSVNAQANMYKMHDLMGLSDTDPEKFMEIDPTTQGLSRTQINEIWKQQANLRKQGQADPHLSKAFTDLEAMYPNSIPPKTDVEGYQNFRGALMDALQVYRNKEMKEPGPTELKEIGHMLIQNVANGRPRWWTIGGFGATSPAYNMDIPPEVIEGARKSDPNITDDEIRNQFLTQQWAQQWNQLYAGKNK